MRANYAGLAVFAGLATIVTGDGLPPDAIPIQCATICGPIVELTALCNVHNNARRRLESREWVPKLAVEPKAGARAAPPVGQTPHHRVLRDAEAMQRRNFTVIRPAPTSFEVEALPTLDLRPTMTLSHLNPVIVDRIRTSTSLTRSSTTTRLIRPTTQLTRPTTQLIRSTTSQLTRSSTVLAPVLPPPAFTLSASSELPTTPSQPVVQPTVQLPRPELSTLSPPPTSNSAATTTVTLGDTSNADSSRPEATGGAAGGAAGGKEQKGTHNGDTHGMMDDLAEEQCVCLNTSFDVAQVAALCSSCIESTGDPLNNAQVIVDTCNFDPQEYSQAKDSIVNNIRVKAVRPANSWDQGSSVDNSTAGTLSPARWMVLGTVGILVMLL